MPVHAVLLGAVVVGSGHILPVHVVMVRSEASRGRVQRLAAEPQRAQPKVAKADIQLLLCRQPKLN